MAINKTGGYSGPEPVQTVQKSFNGTENRSFSGTQVTTAVAPTPPKTTGSHQPAAAAPAPAPSQSSGNTSSGTGQE